MDDDVICLGLTDEEDTLFDEAALSLAHLDHVGADPQPYQELFEAVATPWTP